MLEDARQKYLNASLSSVLSMRLRLLRIYEGEANLNFEIRPVAGAFYSACEFVS